MSCSSLPAAASGVITAVKQIQTSVFSVTVQLPPQYSGSAETMPVPGQFFMLRRKPSAVFLSRPISIYRIFTATDGSHSLCAEFLILEKGTGTQELCSAPSGTEVALIGPLGNTFPFPAESAGKRTALIGGGIGVAPVAGFASLLAPGSFDFYACFKSGSYALDHIQPASLHISTDDGSCGTKGMLPDIFTEQDAALYSAVYACGPEPMLKYVQKTCARAGVQCFLSLESRMACGVGACLGCTVQTVDGNKRCCKDGPVFAGESIVWGDKK